MELSEGTYLHILSRAGLAAKKGVFVLNAPGVIDRDYRDEIMIIIGNFGDQPFEINPGDRVAQGVILKYEKVKFEETDSLTEEDNRGGGLGSTGV